MGFIQKEFPGQIVIQSKPGISFIIMHSIRENYW